MTLSEMVAVIYERIRNLREDSDMTQQQMADRLFLNRRTYSSYENGVRGIPVEVLGNIADIFGTSADYLMGRTDGKKTVSEKVLTKQIFRCIIKP